MAGNIARRSGSLVVEAATTRGQAASALRSSAGHPLAQPRCAFITPGKVRLSEETVLLRRIKLLQSFRSAQAVWVGRDVNASRFFGIARPLLAWLTGLTAPRAGIPNAREFPTI